MSETDGKPYVFAWDSNTRNYQGFRVVKYRVCYPRRISKRWSKAFATEREAQQHAEKVDGFGSYLRRSLTL
jgi:hypothetical protein